METPAILILPVHVGTKYKNMETPAILILPVHVGTKYKRCLYLVLLRDYSGHTPLPNLHSTCFQMKETNDISTSK